MIFSGHEFEEDFFDDYIEPEDYLPKKRLRQELKGESTNEVDSLKGEKQKPSNEDLTKKDKSTNENGKSFSGQLEEMASSSAVESNMTGEQKDGENVSAVAGQGVVHTQNIDKNLDDNTHANEDKKEDTVSMDVDNKAGSNQVICNRLEIVPTYLSSNKVTNQRDYLKDY